MTFVSILFNIKKYLILADQVFNETHLQSLDFVEDDIDTKRKSENIKFTKLVSIYRTIFYILHAGKKKTPLHMITTHVIYDKCKSRELITAFNHIGVSVSYRQVQKAKNNLTQYNVKKFLFQYLVTFPKTCSFLQPWKILIIKTDHHPLA